MKLLSSLTFLFAVLPLAAQEMPQPTAEHKKLAINAGTWDAVMSMTGPDGKAIEGKATSVIRLACGGLWLIDDFSTPNFMGGPFEGHGVTGYDPVKGKYIGTWVDSMLTTFMTIEGTYDRTGKVLTMTGMGPGPDGNALKHTMVTTWHGTDKYVFEMFVTGADGKNVPTLTITYTRRAEKAGDAKAPAKAGDAKAPAK
jgi:hypothetical protein